jgi:hypothetical protein
MFNEGDRIVLTPIRPTLGELAKSFAKDPVIINTKHFKRVSGLELIHWE